jgi:Holliday junction resolvase RusA-like endonuclease
MARKYILNITPQTFIRTTANDRIFFRIPRQHLRAAGLKRLLRIERYNEYKLSVSAEAKKQQFKMPATGAGITFYIPCPKTWSNKKKKELHGAFNQSTPDLDNYLKAFIDSLVSEDKYIAHYSYLAKRWVNFDTGWIEIVVDENEPFLNLQPPAKE